MSDIPSEESAHMNLDFASFEERLRRMCPMCQSTGPFMHQAGMPTPGNGMTAYKMTCECGYSDREERFIPATIPPRALSVLEMDTLLYSQSMVFDGQVLITEASPLRAEPAEIVDAPPAGDLSKLLQVIGNVVEKYDGDIEPILLCLAEQSAQGLERLQNVLALAAAYAQFASTLAYESIADLTWSAESIVGEDRPFKVTRDGWRQATEAMDVILSGNDFDVIERAKYPENLPFVERTMDEVQDPTGRTMEAGDHSGEP